MSKRYAILGFVFFIVLFGFLFISFYREVKQESIKNLNTEQFLHARQAARGIEDFFTNWTKILTILAETDHIRNMDKTGKESIESLYKSNNELIRAVTRVDAKGRILYTIPYNRDAIGKDISAQKHVREIMAAHKPVISDVFFAVQGYSAIAFQVPVFKDNIYQGTIGINVNFQSLAKRYLEDIKIGKTGYAWVLSRDGTELFCPTPGHVGNSVFENCKNFPSILTMAGDMLKKHTGVAVYTFDKVRGEKVDIVRKHAVYMPINIGNTFWSIVVASSEDEIISSLEGFRNKLIVILGVFLFGEVLFFYYGSRAWLILREASKRKQAEESLRKSEEKYRGIFHNAVMGIFRTTPDGRYLSINPAGAKMYGYESEEEMIQSITNMAHQIYVHPEDRNRLQELLDISGFVETFESQHYTKDGSTIWVSINVRVIRDNVGNMLYYETTSQDITARKLTEATLRSSLAEKEVLLREVHHRVKNNLNAIIGLVQLQRQAIEDSATIKSLSELDSRIRSMAIIHEMFYKSQDLAHINFHDYLNTLTSNARMSLGRQTNIDFHLEAGGVEMVLDDAVPCGLIINELISNAIKYAFPNTNNHSGADNHKISITATCDGNTYTLIVADNGIGLPADMDLATSNTLGLYLVKMLGEHQLGGKVEIDRTEGTRIVCKFISRYGRRSNDR
jgi:PAS domain S-box-containing protein